MRKVVGVVACVAQEGSLLRRCAAQQAAAANASCEGDVCGSLPPSVARATLDAALGFEAAYAPLDDSALWRRAAFNETFWEAECDRYDVASLRHLSVVTRSGRLPPREAWLREYLQPLLEQLGAAADASMHPDLREWYEGHKEALAIGAPRLGGMSEMRAQGSGVWAEFFLSHGLLDEDWQNWDDALAVLAPWEFETRWGGLAEEKSCAAWRDGFLGAARAHQARLLSGMHVRASGGPSGLELFKNISSASAPWLVRQPWRTRLAIKRDEQEAAFRAALVDLAPRIARVVRHHTGFAAEGEAAVGFIFACKAMYASSIGNPETAVPCRLLGPLLSELPALEAAGTWRTQGGAAAYAAAASAERLIADVHEALEGDVHPRLQVWCADGVFLSALVEVLGLFATPHPAAESRIESKLARPSSLRDAPAASRLALAITASGALCVEYNGRPAVATPAATWLASVGRRLQASNDGVDL